MNMFRKAFLFVVGMVAIAYEETNKSIKEATKSIEERRDKLTKRVTKAGA